MRLDDGCPEFLTRGPFQRVGSDEWWYYDHFYVAPIGPFKTKEEAQEAADEVAEIYADVHRPKDNVPASPIGRWNRAAL